MATVKEKPSKTLPFEHYGYKFSASFRIERYMANNSICLFIIDDDEYYAEATKYVRFDFDGASIDRNEHLVIKNYSENDGIVTSLINAGVIEPTQVATVGSGFVEMPIHKLTEQFMKTYKKELNRGKWKS
jgi:hypothetical protein